MQRHRHNDSKPYIRIIDWVFHNENEIRQAIEDERTKAGERYEIRNGSRISDPTASKAIYDLTPLVSIKIKEKEIKYPEKWIEVIDKTYEWCKRQRGCHYEVARRRYSGEDYRKTCTELHIDNSTLSRVMNNVRIYAALQAVQVHLIFVE